MENEIMNAREAAKYLHISYWLLLELVKKKQIPAAKLGNRIIIRRSSINNFLNEQESVKK